MIGLLIQGFTLVRGAHRTLLHRARTERGASMVEYALLVGLIAVAAVVGLIALGPAISELFRNTAHCVRHLNDDTCGPQ